MSGKALSWPLPDALPRRAGRRGAVGDLGLWLARFGDTGSGAEASGGAEGEAAPGAEAGPPGGDDMIERAKAGDQQAWTIIYESLHRSLLGYLRARGCPEPEDALGEVFLRLARSLARFEGGLAGLRSYAFTIAQNYLRDIARAQKARPRITFMIPEAVLAAAAGEGRASASAEEDALGSLDQSNLATAFAVLTPEQQHVLYLRIVGDQSVEETARAIGKSPGAVKQLHFRAMERLRRLLAGPVSAADSEAGA